MADPVLIPSALSLIRQPEQKWYHSNHWEGDFPFMAP